MRFRGRIGRTRLCELRKELDFERHLGDDGLDPLTLLGPGREQGAPVGDDVVHRCLLAPLLRRLVVVHPYDERHHEVQHLDPKTGQSDHPEGVVDVLHAAQVVTPVIETGGHRTQDLEANQHSRIARVPVAPTETYDVAVLTPLETRSDHSDCIIVRSGVEHRGEVIGRKESLNRGVQDEPELRLPRLTTLDVRHLDGHQCPVQGIAPAVALVHLYHLDPDVLRRRTEEATGGSLVRRPVDHHEHLADAHGEEALNTLRDVAVAVGPDDHHRALFFPVHSFLLCPSQELRKLMELPVMPI